MGGAEVGGVGVVGKEVGEGGGGDPEVEKGLSGPLLVEVWPGWPGSPGLPDRTGPDRTGTGSPSIPPPRR